MPFYEYRCRDCGHEFEALRPMSERDDPSPCPQCRSPRAERRLSTFAARTAAHPTGPCTPAQAASCGNAGFG
jgi:putative FmdB family regulatory protein